MTSSSSPSFDIGAQRLQRGKPPLIIAEIGVNFNGDLSLAKETIDAAVDAGAGAVKFQTFRAEEFIADPNLTYTYESQGKPVTENAFEMFKRLELSAAWHHELKAYAETRDAIFLSSAADRQAADLLKSIGVPALKIASEDLINAPLLQYVATLNIPVILSTGMADAWEVDRALEIMRPCPSLLLMHCTSLYPTPINEINLLRLSALAETYGYPIGFSDHSLGSAAAVAATALGALMIEKHFTLCKTLPGPDHAMSADPAELAALTAATRDMAVMLGPGLIEPSPGEIIARMDFRRSIVAARDIKSGTRLSAEDLALKRPHTGLHPHEISKVIGRTARGDLKADQQIRWDQLD